MSNASSLLEFYKEFADEQDCIDWLAQDRWGEDATCPRCGVVSAKFYKLANGKLKCSTCRQAFSVRVGTIFEDSKLPLQKWFLAIYLSTSLKKGISSIQLGKFLNITQKSSWFMLQRIRHVFEGSDQSPLEGIVEMDETYVGGVRRAYEKGTKFSNKTAVMGIVEKRPYGKILTRVVQQADASVAIPFIRSAIKQGSKIQTDESRIYHRVKREFEHTTVNHSKGIYVDGDVTTNTIEGAWSHLKKSLDCTYIHVSPKHLQKYCDEFSFRYNTREMNDGERFGVWFRFIVGKRLEYDQLTR